MVRATAAVAGTVTEAVAAVATISTDPTRIMLLTRSLTADRRPAEGDKLVQKVNVTFFSSILPYYHISKMRWNSHIVSKVVTRVPSSSL